MDKNLPRQQETAHLPFAVVVLRAQSNRLAMWFRSRRRYCGGWMNFGPVKCMSCLNPIESTRQLRAPVKVIALET